MAACSGIAGCCAHAATGHAAVLPSPAMNSRRRMLDPRAGQEPIAVAVERNRVTPPVITCCIAQGGSCAGFRTPECRAYPRVRAAGVRKAREPRRLGLKCVSSDIRTGLCSRVGIPPGKGLARTETEAAFLATPADSERQRPRYFASPAAKPRKVNDYSGGARKPELRRTAWWSWQDSNLQPNRLWAQVNHQRTWPAGPRSHR
jgi:hypothetical protein